ncbi:MAG TPA: hypothetical protein VHA52_00845 [Candidatus Babeliaceae bacterium]|nr:hypothetical protein [Candidatus Babeliaceae bacterium]
MVLVRALYFADDIMDRQGKECPVKGKADQEKWRGRIRFLPQKINIRQQRAYQNNPNR